MIFILFILEKKEISVDRGEESYSYNVDDIDPDINDSDVIQSKIGRKRKRSKNFPPTAYDASIPRSHYGVNFESSPDEVVEAIADFLGEKRNDLIGMSFRCNFHNHFYDIVSLILGFFRKNS